MDTQSIVTYKSAFDAIMHEIMADDGSQMEVWYARELQQVCGYARWENFQVAINRAKESCNSQNINTDDHFRDVTKMVQRLELLPPAEDIKKVERRVAKEEKQLGAGQTLPKN